MLSGSNYTVYLLLISERMARHDRHGDWTSSTSTSMDENDQRLESLKQKTSARAPSTSSNAGITRTKEKQKETSTTSYSHGNTTTGVVDRPMAQSSGEGLAPLPGTRRHRGNLLPGPSVPEKRKPEHGIWAGISSTSEPLHHHPESSVTHESADPPIASSILPKGMFGMERELPGAGVGDDDSVGSLSAHWKGAKDTASGDTASGGLRMTRSLPSSPGAPSTLVYQHKVEQKEKQGFHDPTESLTRSGPESKEAIQPLASLMHEFKLNEYQTALYEQKHGSRPSREPSRHISEQTMETPDPVMSLPHLPGDKYPSRLGVSVASLQYEGLPELVEGEALSTLHASQLVGQCLVRDQLRVQSELHEIELSDLLNAGESKLQALQMRNERLEEENRKLKEENRLSTLKMKPKSPEPSMKQVKQKSVCQLPSCFCNIVPVHVAVQYPCSLLISCH